MLSDNDREKIISRYSDRFKEYDRVHRGERTILHRQYLQNHPNYIVNWNNNNNDKLKKYQQKYDRTHKEERREKDKRFRQKHPDYQKEWRKNNPRSSPNYSIDLQDAMNNVRLRDKNLCQWQNCGVTFRNAPIHVHHIFPRNEYPELELVEQYMICYCANHHWLWHQYRGDPCARLLKSHSNFEIKSEVM